VIQNAARCRGTVACCVTVAGSKLIRKGNLSVVAFEHWGSPPPADKRVTVGTPCQLINRLINQQVSQSTNRPSVIQSTKHPCKQASKQASMQSFAPVVVETLARQQGRLHHWRWKHRFWKGLLAVWAGGAVGQSLSFLLARYLVKDMVATYVAKRWSKWDLVDHVLVCHRL
jgi:hypothetical protein